MKQRVLAFSLALSCLCGFAGCGRQKTADENTSSVNSLSGEADPAVESSEPAKPEESAVASSEAASSEAASSESVSSASAPAAVTTPAQPENPEPAPVSPSPAPPASTPSPAPADIDALIASMSLQQKVGQLFIVRVPESGAVNDVKNYQFGGYIMFGRDFANETPDSVRQTIAAYQSASAIPMLIGVDEEGGAVNRVSRYPAFRSTPFPSPANIYRQGGWDAIDANTAEKAELLLSLGVNLNLAPVADLPESSSDFIFGRAFATDPNLTSEFVRRTVSLMNQKGIGCVLKHFPGYGNNADTHTDVVHDNRPYDTFVSRDFLPFTAGINAGAGAVLVAHNIVGCMDGNYPASLSGEVHRILRQELGFSGVIMTDDLYMDAIRKYTGAAEAAVVAVQAGNDMLCCTDYGTQYPAVLAAVQNGVISVERIEESVRRILMWKQSLGILA